MLSGLPFVRGLASSGTTTPLEAVLENRPTEDWPVEISIDGQPYSARRFNIENELWEDHSGPWVGRGYTGRQSITIQGLDGWVLPLRVGGRVSLRLLKPWEADWICMLLSRREDVEDEGRLVTHLEFISDRSDLKC
jgi:hypothetical protein